ncbi:hypothetical protein [uncultured Psychrobacter sp.]|uniref:hypothetical protein n=1 Tax=uncultured Psychrobacter sp. TaxID=259303 RepID=UPI0034599120
MDVSTLPTQLSSDADIYTEPYDGAVADTVTNNDMMDVPAAAADNKKIDPNTIILAQALTDTAISWRIHNCKVSKKTVTQDKPLPFLYHYDSLSDVVKEANPLTPKLLAQFNTPMSADEAAKLIGIDASLITSPWHVKVVGSLVVFSEALQLATRLHWTNTAKDTQQIYTQKSEDATVAAFKDWQFFGRVDVLYKNDKQALISINEQGESKEPILSIDASSDYQLLPATHALTIIAKIEADKEQLPWFEAAILERIE